MLPAVFFDKDGTLIEDTPNVCNVNSLTLEAGIGPCLRTLFCSGYKLFVISNQPGLALGHFEFNDLLEVLKAIEFATAIKFTDVYCCPHVPFTSSDGKTVGCACRKPSPNMILRAANDHRVDLARSWFVGDILNDVEAGNRAGCRTILIDNGNETEWITNEMREPDFVVGNLFAAALTILRTDSVNVSHDLDAHTPICTYEWI